MPNTGNNKPFSIATSSYFAYHPDPDKPQGGFVKLTHEAKRRYEAKGWTFKRTTASSGSSYLT